MIKLGINDNQKDEIWRWFIVVNVDTNIRTGQRLAQNAGIVQYPMANQLRFIWYWYGC